MKMKICPRLLIFRGYDFSIFLKLLFLDRYFGVFESVLRASPPPPPPPGSAKVHGTDFSRKIDCSKVAKIWLVKVCMLIIRILSISGSVSTDFNSLDLKPTLSSTQNRNKFEN